MKKKRSIIILSLFVVIWIFNLPNYAKAIGYCEISLFETDKDIYYNDEIIKINASWDLWYDTEEISFVQIQIFNNSNNLLWYSPIYSEKGFHEGYWSVNIHTLNIPFTNDSNTLYIIFHYYWEDMGGIGGQKSSNLTRQIEIIKRNASCQLIGFPDSIKHGEILQFQARFYDTSSGNTFNLTNKLVSLKIEKNGKISYEDKLTTNPYGLIEVEVPTSNLILGKNYLIFEIDSDTIFKGSRFEYALLIEDSEDNTPGDSDSKALNSRKSNSKNINSLQLSIISFISVLAISIVIIMLIYYNTVKKAKKRNILDFSFKY